MTDTTALKAAQEAADETFDRFLGQDSAATSIPACVVEAAQKAYVHAGGLFAITVIGHGNRTHPVCSVSVRVNRDATARKELASDLRRYAAEIDS